MTVRLLGTKYHIAQIGMKYDGTGYYNVFRFDDIDKD